MVILKHMKQGDIKKVVEYWCKTAEHDYETMLGLFRIKRYPDCLFFGHIVLEKILKAYVVKNTKKEAPKTHNLILLAELAGLNLSEEEKDLLDLTNSFNIKCRYPDFKLSFYKYYNNRERAIEKLNQIKKLYKILCQNLGQKMK